MFNIIIETIEALHFVLRFHLLGFRIKSRKLVFAITSSKLMLDNLQKLQDLFLV